MLSGAGAWEPRGTLIVIIIIILYKNQIFSNFCIFGGPGAPNINFGSPRAPQNN